MITTLHTLSLALNQTSVSHVVGTILPITQIKNTPRRWRECQRGPPRLARMPRTASSVTSAWLRESERRPARLAVGRGTARRLSPPSATHSSEFLAWNRSPGSSSSRNAVRCRTSTSTSLVPLLMAAAIHPMTSHPNEPLLGPAAPVDGGDASATRSTSSGALCSAWSWRQWLTMVAARAGGWPQAKSRSVRSSTQEAVSARSHWAPTAGRARWCVRPASAGGRGGWRGGDRRGSCSVEMSNVLGPCLLPPKNAKFFKIFHHIESLDTCMKY